MPRKRPAQKRAVTPTRGPGPLPLVSAIPKWAQAAAPPPALTVSEWADAVRILPETSAGGGGRWRTSSTPYLRGVMDAVHEIGVQKIAVMGGAQVGKSEALHNILGYFIEHDPSPMLFVHPTATVAEEWSKERLGDMLRTTPALREVVRDDRSKRRGGHDVESTLSLKMFPGGFLALGGANTPNTFARRSVRIVFGDDVDRWPAVVGEEGDPADLLWNRTTTFHNALGLYVSTPTLKKGRIDTLFDRSDQRRYVVACPACGHQDWITWSDRKHFRVSYEGDDPESARLSCPNEACGALLEEADRRAMVADGAWRSTKIAKDIGLVGFHLPTLVSMLGTVSLAELVGRWLSAMERGKETLRVFVNTVLAEGWEDKTARIDSQALLLRREDYGAGIEVPARAAAITAGVDVQQNRFEVHVFAWGPAEERWLVDVRIVPGDPRQPETRAQLLEALNRRYAHALGPQLPIHIVFIDSGYATQEVYDFVLANQVRRYFATKGIAGRSGNPIVLKPSEVRYGRDARPIRLYPINVDDAKSLIMNALNLVPPTDPAAPRPGQMHFPLHLDAVDEEYFAQLGSEHKEERKNTFGAVTHEVWVKDRDRNEGLDGAVLALSAYRHLNPNIRQMLEAIEHAAKIEPPRSGGSGTPAPAAPKPPERRHARWVMP